MFTKITSFASRWFSVLMLFILLVGALGVTPAHAAGILHVAQGGIGDCSSWAGACLLQTALTNAGSGEEIWVTAGTYKPTMGIDRTATFQLKEGVAVFGGFAGTETARDQRDPAANVTILSGDLNGDDDNSNVIYNEPTRADNSYHVVTGADNATLDGFTITAGNANGDDPNCHGGGMYNVSVSSPTLTNIIFIRNSASYAGGGMYNSISSPMLTNVIFKGNSSQAGGGMLTGTGNPTFMNVTFEQNSVSFGGAVGGGLLNSDGSPSLTNVIFRDNVSGNAAGGMLNSNGNPTLTNVIFSGNYANHYGGGMGNEYGNPILVDVTFINNVSTLGGAGMSNSSSSPILTNVTFSGNPSHRGGGMYNVNSSPTLTNVTFTGNNGDAGGGGMYEDSSASVLINVTFKGNTASTYGGGIFSLSNNNLQIQNAIFWGNTAGLNGAQIYNNDDSSSPEVSDSLIQDGCPVGSTCTNIVTADPMLGMLGDYGGFTQTIPLLPGSSAINAGNEATCATTDQRGIARPQGLQCDMGAYEYDYAGIYHVMPLASGTGNCQSWENACILQNALATVIGGDEVWVAAGTHKPTMGTDRAATFQLKDGVAVYGGFAGTETARAQRDPATNVTILSGDLNGNDNGSVSMEEPTRAENSLHVVTGASGAILDGFTITAGNANADTYGPGAVGGGMYNNSSSPVLTNIIIDRNSAFSSAGMENAAGSNPILINVMFSDNSASFAGGGMSNESSNPVLENVTFSGNSAFIGGGLANFSSNPTLTNVTFGNNLGDNYGGGINNDASSPVLTNVTFSGNFTYYGEGSAMNNENGSNPQIRDTIFWGNPAGTGGAQIHNTAGSPVIADSVIQGGCPAESICTNIITADPLLGALGNYGGFTTIFPLLENSSAINAGNDATCAATDQRGVARPLGAHCDMGSYEYPYPIFADVPFTHWANTFVERLYLSKITGGCTIAPLTYCPEAGVTRGQMAVFLLRSMYGATYTPPTATGTVFGDVAANYWAAAWIEQLAAEGITGGCGSSNYCPNTPVTRDQMAVFLLRAEHGNAYIPPAATGVFADVPAGYWAAPWIEQLAAEGITGGCSVDNYCPTTVVNRAQMAVFLVTTFNLP
jgi:hypothetical protein